jgi:hypothetical protein
MQTREESSQKEHCRSKKSVSGEGEKYNFPKGGINIIFGPKYRPLPLHFKLV